MNYKTAFEKILKLEGGYTLHKNKTESEITYAGIYRKAHPAWEGFLYIDKKLPVPNELVERFYLENYWNKFDAKSDEIKYLLFDYGVNAGISKAKALAKQTNPNYTELSSENEIREFILTYSLLRIKHYLSLCNKDNKKYGIYLRGWLNRVYEGVAV